MDRITFIQQKLGKIGAILPGHTSNQRCFSIGQTFAFGFMTMERLWMKDHGNIVHKMMVSAHHAPIGATT